jgi:gluconokinase
MIVLIMGVAGAGKTSIGTALAKELGWTFIDADDYHSAANVAKMEAGVALNDADRQPWLESLAGVIRQTLERGDSAVLACSALKQAYRDVLLINRKVQVVYLKIDYETAAERLRARGRHYMNPNLLKNQFETLEEPADAWQIDVRLPMDIIVARIRSAIAVWVSKRS